MVRFDFNNLSTSTAATSSIVFAVGGGTSVTNTTSLTNADVHSRISFNLANTPSWTVRDIAGATNENLLTTEKLFFVINNSGYYDI